MPAEVGSLGSQLYAHLAQLLAPAGSLGSTKALVILEPAGKDVGNLGTGPAAAEAIADLAGAVPAAAASFVDTAASYDDVWSFVLTSAVHAGPADDPAWQTAAHLIADNRADFDLMARARLDTPGDVYHPVRLTPTDWLSDNGWSSVSFRIGGDHPDPPPPPQPDLFVPLEIPELTWRELDPPPVEIPPVLFERAQPPGFRFPRATTIPPITHERVTQPPFDSGGIREVIRTIRADVAVRLPAEMRWRDVFTVSRFAEHGAETADVAAPASGFRLSFEYRVVSIQRPWLQPQLCRLSGWTIPGLERGGISNGRLDDNPGLLPVLTTRMLTVRNLIVEANWTEADKSHAATAAPLAFGPFVVSGADSFDGTRLTRPAPQVVGWLATVVPACPAT
jgi:hypothetical protein